MESLLKAGTAEGPPSLNISNNNFNSNIILTLDIVLIYTTLTNLNYDIVRSSKIL